jgi:hypothetical protein
MLILDGRGHLAIGQIFFPKKVCCISKTYKYLYDGRGEVRDEKLSELRD